MNATELRALQTPLKDRYRSDPDTARVTLKAHGQLLAERVACRVDSDQGPITAGLHPAAGGPGAEACSGEMLLQALVACAGVTLKAVATALDIPIRGGTVSAEADMDFRGTLGISKETPAGFTAVRLNFALDSDATAEQMQTLLKLTERYCVIYQTLRSPAAMTATIGGLQG